MTDNTGAARPTGKRQLSGAAETSTASYEEKRVVRVDANESSDGTPGGGAGSFIPEVVSEMKKVVWPTTREMVNYTLVVFGFLIVLTALVFTIDTLAGQGVEWALVR
ncbi:MAG: preprotein translocase subunit SecE [Corynebacterium sp.]|nr:preprotein translocase subunit SecE [Corynebacterium sp.]